jgi:hypothetical protein
MKCEACVGLMDKLIEGELDGRLARETNAHIAMCASCSQLYANLRSEQELYGKYLLGVEPTPALWANLQLELEKKKVIRASQPQLRLQRWFQIAFGGLHVKPHLGTALVLITIGLAIGIIVWRTTIDSSRRQAQNPAVVAEQPSPEVNREGTYRDPDITDRPRPANDNERKIQSSSTKSGEKGSGIHVSTAGRAGRRTIKTSPVVPTVDQVTLRAEQQYLFAIEILSRDIKRRRAFISPALLSQLETALTEVDLNIAATRRVAREQRRDPFAAQYLALAYEKKVELLREVISW